MITFIISLVALMLGYLVYGAIVERVMRPDDRDPHPTCGLCWAASLPVRCTIS